MALRRTAPNPSSGYNRQIRGLGASILTKGVAVLRGWGKKKRSLEDKAQLLAELYDQCGSKVYGYVLALVSDPSDAEEIVQDVFARMHSSKRVPRDPQAYLFRAARNEAYSRLRRRRLGLRVRKTLEEQPALLVQATDSRPHGEREAIEAALRTLPAKQREIVVLKVYEDMTFQEIAEILEISPNTAASRYRYALEKLRVKLKKEDFVI